ncbi:MAG: TonB-dependent receptor [Flavobacteriaceae bacterium]|nr:TonB-dependent receptor [Flavobacteriaceae bacterium]
MFINFIRIVVLISPFTLFAQNSISGGIFNAENEEAIANATIYLPQLEKGTTSKEDGSFTLEYLPRGKYKIVISFLGYQTISETVTIPSEDSLIYKLNPSAIEMEEVILSTPFHKLQRENVMKVEQVKVEDLKKNGMVSLSSAITEIPGVSSVSTGLNIGKPVIRGLSSNRVLVYTQGVRLENQQFGEEHGLGLSGSGVESIEVIKGPASLLYGSDALGGVLYVNPERYTEQDSLDVDLNGTYFTNTEGYNSNFGIKTSGKQFKYLFRAGITGHSDYENAVYRVTNSRFKEQDIKAGIGFQKTNFKTDLRYNFIGSQIGLPEEIGVQETSKEPLLPNQDLQSHIVSSRSSWFFNNGSLDMDLGYIYNDRKEFEEHEHEGEEEEEDEEEGPALHMKLNTFNYNIKYNLPKSDKFETIVGIQGMFQDNSNFGEETLIPDAKTTDFGLMATSHIHFDKSDLQLGLRFDTRLIDVESSFSNRYNSFNLAAGWRTDLNENIISRINVATGFRAPNLAELASDGTHEGTNRYEIGNPDLENERNFQADLALEYQSDHLEFFVNAFYNLVSNYIFLTPTGEFVDADPVFNYIQEDARLFGGEISLHYHPHPLDWMHFESSFEMVNGRQNNDEFLPLIPANVLSNTVRVEFERPGLKNGFGYVRFRHTFDQENPGLFEERTGGYSLFDAGIGATVTLFNQPLDIRVIGSNLFDKTYLDHLSRLRADGIPNIGRNFSIGITYRF